MKTAVFATIGMFITGFAAAEPLKLSPANPQPSAASLKPGLAVSYAYGAGGRTLKEAKSKLRRAKPGKALQGLSYLDTNEGEKALTSDQAFKVAAQISGFIRFDAAGTFEVDFFTNDGLQATIGGQQVALFDGVHGCEPSGVTQVRVPSAGWYALDATYFQRKGSSCLMMDWSAGGAMAPVPDGAFAHK